MSTKLLSRQKKSIPDDQIETAEAYQSNAERLADFWMKKANRTDVYGGYRLDGGEKKLTTWKRPLTRNQLIQHACARVAQQLVGLHAIGLADTCWWICIDIDAHRDEDPELNRAAAVHWELQLVEMGFSPLLVFDGKGSFHLWLFFSEPIPAAVAYRFGRWIIRDHVKFHADDGLPAFGNDGPEVFPKAPTRFGGKGFRGGWVRLLGVHHDRLHWSQVWDGTEFVGGNEAIEIILAKTGDLPQLIPAECWTPPEPTAPTSTLPRISGCLMDDAEKAQKCLPHIPNNDVHYDDWLRIGGAIHHATGGSAVGFDLFDSWSGKSSKYDAATTRKLWSDFTCSRDKLATAGSLVVEARKNGFELYPPKEKNTGNGEVINPPIDADSPVSGPVLTCMADVESQSIEWLWPGRIPIGRITLMVGAPGGGKSFFTTDAGSRVTTGSPWPDGSPCPSGSVLFICAEDDPADTIRPRLDAHHADVRRVHLLSSVRRLNQETGEVCEVVFTLADVASLESALQRLPDCKLVVIDPIGSFIGGGIDAHRDNEVRSVLAPLARLAQKYGVAVVVIAHRRKGLGPVADDTALGSRAFTAIARVVHHLSKDPHNPRRRLLLPGKNNLAPEGDGLAFTIVGDPPALSWERDPVCMTADEALAIEQQPSGDDARPGPEPEERNEAVEWLKAELADLQEHPVSALREAAQAAGLVWRTVQRARQEAGALVHRSGFQGGFVWRLPKPGNLTPPCQPPK